MYVTTERIHFFSEHKVVLETLLNVLESVRPIQASTCTPIDDVLASLSHKMFKSNDTIYGATII